MSRDTKTILLSWNNIENIISKAVGDIKKNGVPDAILAIQRGGFIPAVMLSHALDVREIIPLNIRVTVDDTINSAKIQPIIEHNLNAEKISGKNILIVDDIIGSGFTHRAAINYLMEYQPATVRSFICVINQSNWEKDNIDLPNKYINYIGMKVRGWVEFPWE